MRDTSYVLRPARERDQDTIRRLVRMARIYPMGLGWRRFLVAESRAGKVIGCGQVKPHRDGSRELASIVVDPAWRGRGVAGALIDRLMQDHGPPLWLVCRSGLRGLYQKFGFRTVAEDEAQPLRYRRLRRLVRALGFLAGSGEHLAVMVWEAASRPAAPGKTEPPPQSGAGDTQGAPEP
jgi:N-acetylglutamate synthase-like GNAT family acetyltransferase